MTRLNGVHARQAAATSPAVARYATAQPLCGVRGTHQQTTGWGATHFGLCNVPRLSCVDHTPASGLEIVLVHCTVLFEVAAAVALQQSSTCTVLTPTPNTLLMQIVSGFRRATVGGARAVAPGIVVTPAPSRACRVCPPYRRVVIRPLALLMLTAMSPLMTSISTGGGWPPRLLATVATKDSVHQVRRIAG